MRSIVKRAGVIILLGMLFTACVIEEKKTETPVVKETAPVRVKTATAAAVLPAAREGEVTPASAAGTLEDAVAHPARGDCKSQAPWIQLARCVHEDRVYATASVSGVQEIGLARSTAGDRARRALTPGPNPAIAGSEVIDFFRCRGASYALARMPAPAGISLPACDAKALAVRSPVEKSCPEWIRGIAWKDDAGASAVGAAKMHNASLAEAAATNRARAEIGKLMQTDTKSSGGTTTSVAKSEAYSEIAREKASCDGVTYMKLVVRGVGSGEDH